MLNEMVSACGTCGRKRNAYGALEGKLERKIPLGRTRRRRGGSIKMDVKVRCGKAWTIFGFRWGQVCSCEHGNERLGFIKYEGLLDCLRWN
jgi:hypothetical protein